MATYLNPHNVKVGQVWRDTDPRTVSEDGSPRYIRVVQILPALEKAIVERVKPVNVPLFGNPDPAGSDTEFQWKPGHPETKIALKRFKPNSSGYELVKDVKR